jgi:hypothetical protein
LTWPIDFLGLSAQVKSSVIYTQSAMFALAVLRDPKGSDSRNFKFFISVEGRMVKHKSCRSGKKLIIAHSYIG